MDYLLQLQEGSQSPINSGEIQSCRRKRWIRPLYSKSQSPINSGEIQRVETLKLTDVLNQVSIPY